MTDIDYLLDAIDKLTLKDTTKVMQANEAGISCISEVEHDALLVQLREAVIGGIGKHAGSSSARERLPFDAGALALFDEIAEQVNAWYQPLPGAREDRRIEDRLRDWYIDYENKRRAGQVSESPETLRLVQSWAHRIEVMFDPPERLELMTVKKEPVLVPKVRRRVDSETGEVWKEPVLVDGEPVLVPKLKGGVPVMRVVKTEPSECPVCGERYAFDPKTGDMMLALIIEYRRLGLDTLDQATGLCRSCGKVWRGRSGISELPGFGDIETA